MRKLLLVLFIIVLTVSLVGVMVACNPKENNGDDPTPSGEISETTFLTAAQNVKDPKTAISVIYIAEEYEVYSLTASGTETVRGNIPFDRGSFASGTALLKYRTDSFSTHEIKGTKFTGTLASPKEFFGVTDSDTQISNAVVVIDLNADENNSLKKIEVGYTITIQGEAFKATITVTP